MGLDSEITNLNSIFTALKQHHVPGAAVESQPDEAGCMPGTRVKLLGDILALLQSYARPHIVWIAGMAGTGKTSMANTVCSMIWMDPNIYLGGSFFCSRSAGSVERTDVKRIIPTLATLLARQFPAFGSSLAKQLSEIPDVAHWSVRNQVERLLVQPLEALASYTGQIVFVIDALDECNNPSLLAELIDSIADFESTPPVKFLLTSRPEMHIRTTPISDPVLSSILHLHTVDLEQVTKDIRLYIGTKFAQASKTATWYSADDIEALVSLSGGLFIFASTATKYVLDRGNDAGRRERLQKATSGAYLNSKVATQTLDQIYELVITEASHSDQVDTDELMRMRTMLACVLTARASLSVQALADLIGSGPDTLRGSIDRLHSLVHLPDEDIEPGVRALHASFGDYMLGRAADHIRLPPSLGHDLLADGCLRRMGWNDLRFNISRSRSSYEPNAEFQQDSISLSLIYACLHWARHIDSASARSVVDEMVGGTFRRKFLFWLEVLSITGKMGFASGLLRIASSAVSEYFQLHAGQLMIELQVKSQEVAQFLRDANSFVVSSHAAIARSAPHIYVSAVPFASKDSLVYLDFAPLCTAVISVETFGTDHHASRLVMTLTGHEAAVTSITYSPSGDLLAAGLKNGTVHIWDTRTGEEVVSPMKSGNGAVYSVAFTPDGQRLASGTDGDVVSVWNVATGRLDLQRPPVDSDWIELLAFSPNGKLVASYSGYKIVYLWNVETGQIVSTPAHGYDHISLSFSSDGTILALRSWNRQQLWHTGAPGPEFQLLPFLKDYTDDNLPPLDSSKLSLTRDYTSGLMSVTRTGRVQTFPTTDPSESDNDIKIHVSPEETSLVASGDDYVGLHLWDLRCIDAGPTLTILGAHVDTDSAISFSSDGRYLASGFKDRIIRIWDVVSGRDEVQHVQESGVVAVAVSPDNSFIVCGREDGSVHLSDVKTGEAKLHPLIGHKESVRCVAISPNGQIIASGSRDDTVKLWHVQTGDPLGEPFRGHEDDVIAVTFSPDAQWIASGSTDGTILVWDVATGNIMNFAPMKCRGWMRTVTFSPNGQVLAAMDSKSNIYFWHLGTNQLVHRYQQEGLKYLALSPGANRLLASYRRSRDDLVFILDVNTGEQLHSIDGQHGLKWFEEVAWSPCERFVASLSHNQTLAVNLWDLAHGTISVLRPHDEGLDLGYELAFAPNGRFMVVVGDGGTIQVWDIEGARSLASRAEHDPVIRLSNADLKDGWLMGPSGELLLWVPTDYQKHLAFLPHPGKILSQRRIVVTVGDCGLKWGEDWHACWRGAVL